MSTVTVPRPDLTTEEVAGLLRQSLGARYHVLPATAVNYNPVGKPRSDQPDTIVVATGSDRLFRAQVRLTRGPGQTVLHIRAGGIGPVPRIINRLRIVRPVLQALQTAPTMR